MNNIEEWWNMTECVCQFFPFFLVKDCSFAVCKLAGVPEDYIDALLDEKYMEDLIASKQHQAIRSQGVSKIEHDRGIYNEDEHSYGEFINLIWLSGIILFFLAHTYSPVSMYRQRWTHLP